MTESLSTEDYGNVGASDALSPEEEANILRHLGLSYPPNVVAVLRNPTTGNLAYVVATAHVSAQAAEDVEAVITAVHPDIIAVELDSGRLKRARKMLVDGPKPPPTSVGAVFRRVWLQRDPMWQVVLSVPMAGVSAILGVPYGADMLTALRLADESGTKVVPIDRSGFLTGQRAMRQWSDAFRRNPDFGKKDAKIGFQKMGEVLLKGAEEAGCDDPPETIEAFTRLMQTLQQAEEVSVEDFLRVRSCGRRVIEKVRQSPDYFKALDVRADVPGLPDLPAVTQERDLILAQNLRRCTEEGTTVGVVGAAHLAGIRQRWTTALSPASLAESQQYMKLLPPYQRPQQQLPETPPDLANQRAESAPELPSGTSPAKGPPGTPGGLLAGLGALGLTGLLAYRRPRLVIGAALVIGGFGAAGQVGMATMIARYGRSVDKLREASEKVAMEGGQEGF